MSQLHPDRAEGPRRSRRHRRSGRPGSRLPLEHLSARVQEQDHKFFEKFCALHFKLESEKRHLMQRAAADGSESTGGAAVNKLTIKFGQMSKLSQPQLDSLYVEVLYTIRHKVGVTTGEHTPFADDLYNYAQDAFRISANEHQRLLSRASKEKPPVVLLNVVIVEAKRLIAKDANGFSDPYCMLGVLPGKRRSEMLDSPHSPRSPQESEDHGFGSSPSQDLSPGHNDGLEKRRGSIIQRIGGSFRRKNKTAALKPGDCAIPVKLIKASSVQRCTLNPKWNEKFQLLVEDAKSDRFHLDIWDHDDEGSVVDAVTKLNEISSLKGLGRFFKQVAQSARTENDESVDDFLGCVTIRTKDVPSTGLDEWFTLEGRTVKSKVSGEINLKLWLGTREERPEQDDDDNIIDVNEHVAIIRVFTEHEIRKAGADPTTWDGVLPQAALTILHQHAIQGDLTEVQQAMCYWLAGSKIHLDTTINYDHLYELLNRLFSLWKPTELSKDEEDMVTESFSQFVTLSYDQIVRHRDLFPIWEKTSASKLEGLLRCVDLLHKSDLFNKCLPFRRELNQELPDLIKKSAIGYYERAKYCGGKKKESEEDSYSPLIHLLTVVNACCSQAHKLYHQPFASCTTTDYFLITYRELDRLVEAELCCQLMDKGADTWNALLATEADTQMAMTEPAKPDGLLSVFELQLALSEFLAYRDYFDETERKNFVTGDYGRYFERAMELWLDMAKKRLFERVDQACQVDKDIRGTDVVQSSSYVDVCFTLKQVVEFWERIRLSNVQKNAVLTERLIQICCQAIEYYSDKLFALLAHAGFYDDNVPISNALTEKLCVTLNDAEQARRVVTDLNDKLHLDEISARMEDQLGQAISLRWRSSTEHLLDSCNSCVSGQMEMALNRLVDCRKDAFKKHIFHLAWAPQGCPIEEAVNPLIKTLDAELMNFHRCLLHRNFTRLLFAEFKAILQHINDTVDENPGLEPEFYQRLFDTIGVLNDFFHAGGKGLSKESVQEMALYQNLMKQLALNQTATNTLIEQYYNDLINEQNEVSECKYGILNIRAYYNAMATTLVVDVIGAKQIIALDPNGLSDPFVIVELVPNDYFKQCPVVKTKVVSKSLAPVFDETFEFSVTPNLPPCALLHFIVMDHDWMRSNDFAGEAFLQLSDVPGFGTNGGGAPSALRQFNLILMHPVASERDKSTTAVLSSRKEDKDAQNFVRHIETVRNI